MKSRPKKANQQRSYKQYRVFGKGAKLLFIFGPEGGLSPAEIESFVAKGAILAGLGPRILRAETAPLYALSAISVLLELKK